jgi:hypothetical protein
MGGPVKCTHVDESDWMRSNRLQLNMDKTELMWCLLAVSSYDDSHLSWFYYSDASASVQDFGIYITRTWYCVHTFSGWSYVVSLRYGCVSCAVSIDRFRVYHTDTRYQPGAQPTWLRKCCSGWPPGQSSTSDGVGAQIVSQIDPRSSSVGSHYWRSGQPSLALCARPIHYKKLLTFRALRGEAPRFLSDQLVRVADVSSRRLRFSSTMQLMVPLCPYCRQSFISCCWTSNPESATCWCDIFLSLPEFRQKLETHLFSLSYPKINV